MKRLKALFNSQRTAIFILLVLNLLQLRYLGLMHMRLNDIEERLSSIEQSWDKGGYENPIQH